MSYVLVKVLPNYIPVTTDKISHYCDLDFMIYKSKALPLPDEKIMNFRTVNAELHKAPRITIAAKTGLPDSINSEEELCISTDIPATGYSYTEPQGWTCSHTYDAKACQLTFEFSAPVDGNSAFQAVNVKVNGFFTTAQAGVCALEVRVENFNLLFPDVQDTVFTIVVSKKYHLEIIDFTANGMREKFFFNHHLPVLFHWDMVCDADTEYVLLEDDAYDMKAQGFSGEKNQAYRDKGDHTYSLKMILPGGDRTKSIVIRDTKWRKLDDAVGVAPDFSKKGTLLEYKKNIYMFFENNVYQSSLSNDYILSDWKLFGKYEGDIMFSAHMSPVISDGKLYLIGGKKKDSDSMFYAVCDLTQEKCSFKDYSTELRYMDAEGTISAAACDVLNRQSQWLVYAYGENHDGYYIFCTFDAKRQIFSAIYFLLLEERIVCFDIGIRENILYVALASADGIIIQKMEKEEGRFTDGGKIEGNPRWMRWIRGNNNMFLLTDFGLYQGDDWTSVEAWQPFLEKSDYPWCGSSRGKIVGLISTEDESGAVAVWATDTL